MDFWGTNTQSCYNQSKCLPHSRKRLLWCCYDFPNERFALSEKGMVRQRVFAINDAKTPYVLLLDDDVEFEPDFVAKLLNTMTEAQTECCVAQVFSIVPGVSRLKKIINHMISSVVYKNTHDQFYRKINLCGGYVVNTGYDPNKPVYSQSGHGSHCQDCSLTQDTF